MIKRLGWIAGLGIVMFLVSGPAVFAEGSGDAERKAKEIHDLASSDVIFVQDELKALYYQNLQIIDLLKQIRDILDMKLENTKN